MFCGLIQTKHETGDFICRKYSGDVNLRLHLDERETDCKLNKYSTKKCSFARALHIMLPKSFWCYRCIAI